LIEKSRTAAIRKLLRALAATFEVGTPTRSHVRTNIMLSHNGRRKVQAETAYNMHDDTDEDLSMEIGAGISGRAARSREPFFGDLTADPPGKAVGWGLKKSESKRVREGLKSIMSVPLFNPADPAGPILGTLQVDSDLPLSEMFPDQIRAGQVATTFADAISLVLKS
jgi:hypothetical protein